MMFEARYTMYGKSDESKTNKCVYVLCRGKDYELQPSGI